MKTKLEKMLAEDTKDYLVVWNRVNSRIAKTPDYGDVLNKIIDSRIATDAVSKTAPKTKVSTKVGIACIVGGVAYMVWTKEDGFVERVRQSYRRQQLAQATTDNP